MRITDSHDERGSYSSLSAYVLVELADIVIVDFKDLKQHNKSYFYVEEAVIKKTKTLTKRKHR